MTINCARWKEVAFSAEYYRSGQKLLVPAGHDSAKSLADLSGKTVCAPAGSTSLDNLKKANPKVIPVTADTDTGCLVLFQQGKVDGITGDDTVLAGDAAQDPYAQVTSPAVQRRAVRPRRVNKSHVDFVRFVNGVLEQMKADGRVAWRPTTSGSALPSARRGAAGPCTAEAQMTVRYADCHRAGAAGQDRQQHSRDGSAVVPRCPRHLAGPAQRRAGRARPGCSALGRRGRAQR